MDHFAFVLVVPDVTFVVSHFSSVEFLHSKKVSTDPAVSYAFIQFHYTAL